MRRFGDYADAFASGWMMLRGTRRRRGVDRGFVLSDHADWPGLLWAIEQSGAQGAAPGHKSREAAPAREGASLKGGLGKTVSEMRSGAVPRALAHVLEP